MSPGRMLLVCEEVSSPVCCVSGRLLAYHPVARLMGQGCLGKPKGACLWLGLAQHLAASAGLHTVGPGRCCALRGLRSGLAAAPLPS